MGNEVGKGAGRGLGCVSGAVLPNGDIRHPTALRGKVVYVLAEKGVELRGPQGEKRGLGDPTPQRNQGFGVVATRTAFERGQPASTTVLPQAHEGRESHEPSRKGRMDGVGQRERGVEERAGEMVGAARLELGLAHAVGHLMLSLTGNAEKCEATWS